MITIPVRAQKARRVKIS